MHQVGADEQGIVVVSREPKLQMVDLGERRLALTSSGEGEPTVVLETGLGAESGEWAEVQRGIDGLTRVCRYDRAGRGLSEIAPGPRSALQMVEDLRRLLEVAAIPGPYILVGHSFGGLLARLYAHRHGESVASIVLVDSMHEDQFDVFGPLFPPSKPSEDPGLSAARAFWTGGWRDSNATVERIDLISSIAQARELTSLGRIPVHVMAAGTLLNNASVPKQYRAALQQRWEDLQQRFLQLSSRATYYAVPLSGHFVQRDDPRALINVIQTAVAEARACQLPREPATNS